MPPQPPLSRLKCWAGKSFPPLARAAYLIGNRLRTDRFLFEGFVSGRRLRTLLLGTGQMAAYYSSQIFDNENPRPLQPDAASPDIVLSCAGLRHGGGLALPKMVRGLLDLPDSMEDYEESLGDAATADIRKIRSAGLRPEVSKDPADLALFYHGMYLPTLASRHGEHSIVAGPQEMGRFFRKGFLLMIRRGRETHGGVLAYDCGGGRLVLKYLGVLGGDFRLTRAGVNSAIIAFSISHAINAGHRVLDFGLGGPFRTDGLIAYKKKWGVRFVADKGADTISLAFRDGETGRFYLERRRPFLLGGLEQAEPPPEP